MTTSSVYDIADELMAQRDAVVEKIKPLRALYGAGSYLGERDIKQVEATVALEIRDAIAKEGGKVTEGAIEARVRLDRRYQQALETDRKQREAWIDAEEELNAIEWRLRLLQSANALAAAEARLSR